MFAVGGRGRRIASYFRSIGYKGPKPLYAVKGKPLLSRLIDMSFSLGFQRVYLLSNFYESDILSFVGKYYQQEPRLKIIKRSRFPLKNKVPPMLYSLSDRLREPFVYSDGNVIYSRNILSALMRKPGIVGTNLINLVVSRRDYAKTHLIVQSRGRAIVGMNARLGRYKNQLAGGVTNYYSLGLMAVSPQVFKSFTSLGKKVDLDFVLQEIFANQLRSGKNYIKITKYRGKWLAVHDKTDIDRMAKIL